MSDPRAALRSLPFAVIAPQLGWDISKFRRSRQDWAGPCPLHGSKNNHNCFRYHDSGKFHCFSCGAKGSGSIDLTMKARQCSFTEAVAFLEGLSAAVPTQPPAKEKSSTEANSGDLELKPYSGKYEKYKVDCPWLEARIPDAAIREKYGVFCYNNPARKSAYSGRVMIPIKDASGILWGYLGRSTDTQQEPKYLFPKDFPKTRFVFGAAELKSGVLPLPLKLLYVAESPWTVMRFAMMHLPCVALYGWSVSPEQIDIVSSLTRAVCYLPDRNKAGQQSAAVVQAFAQRLYVHAPELPDGVDDPEGLLKLQILAL